MQPLDDLTVVDVALTLPGPYASLLFERLGAEVVSIEPPDGDALRHRDPSVDEGAGELFEMLNEGKQTVAVDLKDDRGREFLLDLTDEADVFIEGFRPGVVDRLGIGPDTLRERNPDLVYCSLSGFGQTGPRRDQPAHALNYEGLAGLLDPEDPSMPGFPVADFAGGQMLAFAALAAIRGRDRGGGGRYVDLGLFEVLASWNVWNSPWADGETRGDPLVGGEYPCYNTYRTADGRHLTLGIMEPSFWETLCERLDRPDLVDDQFDTGGKDSETYRELQAEFAREPLETWVERLSMDLPIAAVQSPEESLTDPQVRERERVFALDEGTGRTVRHFDFPVEFDDDPSESGETAISAAGYDDDRLEELRDEDVLTTEFR